MLMMLFGCCVVVGIGLFGLMMVIWSGFVEVLVGEID